MRKLLSLFVAAFVALAVSACQEQPTTLDQQDVRAGHGSGVVTASADLDAVNTMAASQNGFTEGDDVGTIDIADDQAADQLAVTGSASGLDPDITDTDDDYLSLFYGSGSSATSPDACEPPDDPDNQLSTEQMLIGSWEVDSNGDATLGPRTMGGEAYVSVDEIETVSIRDTRVDAGFGPDAVVACGYVHTD